MRITEVIEMFEYFWLVFYERKWYIWSSSHTVLKLKRTISQIHNFTSIRTMTKITTLYHNKAYFYTAWEHLLGYFCTWFGESKTFDMHSSIQHYSKIMSGNQDYPWLQEIKSRAILLVSRHSTSSSQFTIHNIQWCLQDILKQHWSGTYNRH